MNWDCVKIRTPSKHEAIKTIKIKRYDKITGSKPEGEEPCRNMGDWSRIMPLGASTGALALE